MPFKTFFFFSFLHLLCASCSTSKAIYYSFGGVTVTRIDFDGATNFYYGSCNDGKNDCSKSNFLVAEYYGFNNGMDVIMVFKKDSTVELIYYGMGLLKKNGSPKIELPHYNNDDLDNILKKYRKSGLGVIRLSNLIDLERKFPENKDSKVTAQYDF